MRCLLIAIQLLVWHALVSGILMFIKFVMP